MLQEPEIDERRFQKQDWVAGLLWSLCQTSSTTQCTHPNAPEAQGMSALMHCFVDANHAGCKVTRQSHTGVLFTSTVCLFFDAALNDRTRWKHQRLGQSLLPWRATELIEEGLWYYKLWMSGVIEIVMELIEGLWYMLRMFGVTIDGPTNVFCDSKGVIWNVPHPEFTLEVEA